MLTLVRVERPPRRVADDTLGADVASLERQRQTRAPLMRASIGFAVVIVLGALLGDVPRAQAGVAAAVCLAPASGLAAAHAYRRRQLWRRLDRLRANLRGVRKS